MKSAASKAFSMHLSPFVRSFILAFLFAGIYNLFKMSHSFTEMVALVRSFPYEYLAQTVVLTMLIYAMGISLMLVIKVKPTTYAWKTCIPAYILLFFISAGALFIFALSQNSLNLRSACAWLYHNPIYSGISLLLLVAVTLFIFSLAGSYYTAALISTTLLGLLAVTSYLKLKILGQPLYPSDFEQIKQLKDLIPMVAGKLTIFVGVGAFLAVQLLILLKKKLPHYSPHWLHRIVLASICGCIIWSYVHYESSIMSKAFKAVKVEFTKWDPLLNYNVNGPVLGFILSINQTVFEKPNDYTKEHVIAVAKRIMDSQQTSQASAQPAAAMQKPNIIYLMAEAFWDPTRLPKTHFSEDPIPYIREVMKNNTSGLVLSPMFGGGTANVEFEALTGFSLSLMKPTSVPYAQVFDGKDSVPTIASILRKRGYEAVALHSFEKYFFERDTVYPKLGFQSFTSMHEMKYREMAAEHVSNMSVSKELIDMLKSKEQPLFIHTVTMQNHFPFPPTRFKETKIDVTGFDEATNKSLEIYTEGVRQTSEALQYLIEQLQQLDEPTVIVFWGDHLPTFSEHNQLYNESGFITTGGTPEEARRMHETPFFITANFPLPSTKLGTISPIYLGPTLFNMLQEPLPPYYQFLTTLYERYHGLIHEVKVNSTNETVASTSKEDQKLLEEYRLLQYDLLVGKQYSRSILFPEN